MNAFKTLFLTELKLSWRGLDMVIFALALPVVVMVLIGLLYGQQAAFAGAEHTFVEQSFGAVSTIAICAGGLMGLPLVIAEARHRKLFNAFLGDARPAHSFCWRCIWLSMSFMPSSPW